jgi:hypothetical protein
VAGKEKNKEDPTKQVFFFLTLSYAVKGLLRPMEISYYYSVN